MLQYLFTKFCFDYRNCTNIFYKNLTINKDAQFSSEKNMNKMAFCTDDDRRFAVKTFVYIKNNNIIVIIK